MFYDTPYNDKHTNVDARVCLWVCVPVSLIPFIKTKPNGKSMTNLLPCNTCFVSYLPIAILPNK